VSGKIRFLGSGDSFGSGGRFQTCILGDIWGRRFLLDCGASSLIAMRAQGIDPNSIDSILLTHMHGDHCAGVPFVLLDAMLGSKRQAPLYVAGPPGTAQRMDELREALFPGSRVMKPKFHYEYIEMAHGRTKLRERHGGDAVPRAAHPGDQPDHPAGRVGRLRGDVYRRHGLDRRPDHGVRQRGPLDQRMLLPRQADQDAHELRHAIIVVFDR
jgi:ribonuclease BN (tRNA processing enzyme)